MSDLEDEFASQIKLVGLPEPVRQYKFSGLRRFRADFGFPEQKLLAEVDGGSWVNGRHTRGSGFEKDCERASEAAVLGYRVLRFTGAMVKDGRAIAYLERALGAEGSR